MRNIVLLGFMGTGKTVISKKISEETGMQYVSTDEMITKTEGIPINEIFTTKGETYFREIEKNVVRNVSLLDNVVIDAGGGVVKDLENIKNLRMKAVLISLWAKPEDIYRRTRPYNHRPLINVSDPQKKIKELLEKRKPLYDMADYHVNTSSVNINEAVQSIIKFAKTKT